ncbi:MAG: hypothetical protein ACOX4R_08295 [Lentihominibacter sp.]|jgi:hypothetical protein
MYFYGSEKFVVESKRQILDIVISPSFSQNLNIQIHKQNDGQWVMCWKFGLMPEDGLGIVREYMNNSNEAMSFSDSLKNEELISKLQEIEQPAEMPLSDKQIALIKELIAIGLPVIEEKPLGLDGHNFKVTVFDEIDIVYECWCIVPDEWELLAKVINCIVASIEADYDSYAAGIYERKKREDNTIIRYPCIKD